MTRDDAVLCYVRGQWVWFTTCPLDKQSGDDWNDAPYDCNAGNPYEWEERRGVPPYEVFRVAIHGDVGQHYYSKPWYSVNQINRGETWWLRFRPWSSAPREVYAGTTYAEFRRLCDEYGVAVYVKEG